MSCIHYKFRSALEYDTITFDGLSISLADLKHSIITQKKFAKNTDFDLEVTNAQTKEQYKDEMTMIPKNSSVVVRRIPIGTKSKAQLAAERSSPFSSGEQKTSAFQDYQVPKINKLSKVADLANADASEEDKLKAMMKQSGEDWDPSQYVRGRRPYASGVPVPQNYVCYRCGKPGHFIRNCPTNGSYDISDIMVLVGMIMITMSQDTRFDVPKAKRTTGIPRTFLDTTSEGTVSPPARVSPSLSDGDIKTKGKEKDSTNKKVPSELRCPMCNNLLTDAVLIPCCGTSYCDDCIRNYLLENEQECPSCGAENVSPDSLVINKQLRQAVNTFKNAQPAGPYFTPVTKSAAATNKSTEVKSQPATKDVADSVSDKAAPESKPAVENKVEKEINDKERKTKESSPKPPQPVNPAATELQPIRVHHRDAISQQGPGFKPGGVPFDPRRRQGNFHPRGPPRVPEVRHGLSEPIIPHGLPPEHVPRIPAVRPNMPGPSHLRPRMNVPGYMPAMRAAVPSAAIPHIPPVPTMVRPALPHHPAFGAPVFDPLHPVNVSRSLTPPMSEREFYKMQKKLKSRNKKKHEHPSSSYTSRESRSRKEPRKDAKKDPTKESGLFDFDDELSEYRKLQKSRQRLRSRSLTPSRSRSRSLSRSRSRSRSRSHSSKSPARSPTPEGWDESRSPSPTSSRDKSGTGSPEEEKRKHKKRKKEQKGKERKKQKTSHVKEGEASAEQKEEVVADKIVAKTSEKKKHKRLEKVKSSNKETEEEREKDVGKEKEVKEVKEKRKEKEKEKGKKKDKEKKKGSDKEKGKEKEEKKSKEKKKKKDKSKKDEMSTGKKRKNKKKHKKHKRRKKEKSKDEKDGDEEETNDSKVKKSDDPRLSPGDEHPDGKNSTEDEKENETQDSDEGEQQDESEEEENDSSDERMSEEEMKGEVDDEEGKEKEERQRSEEREGESRSDEAKSGNKVDQEEKKETGKSNENEEEMISDKEEKGETTNKHGKPEVATESEDDKLGAGGSDREDEVNEDDVDEEQLLKNGSDDDVDQAEVKMAGNGNDTDKEADVEIDHTKLGENGSCGEIQKGSNIEDKDFGGREDKLFGIGIDK